MPAVIQPQRFVVICKFTLVVAALGAFTVLYYAIYRSFRSVSWHRPENAPVMQPSKKRLAQIIPLRHF